MFHIKPNYVTDEDNRKVAVQLNINTFKKIENVLENYGLYKLMEEESADEMMNVKEAKAYYKKLKKKK